jgi:hypothetical protein
VALRPGLSPGLPLLQAMSKTARSNAILSPLDAILKVICHVVNAVGTMG